MSAILLAASLALTISSFADEGAETLRVARWRVHVEPSAGIVFSLPRSFKTKGGKLISAGEPKRRQDGDYIQVKNVTDDGSGAKEFLSGEYSIETVERTEPRYFDEFKSECEGKPAKLPKLNGGYWCKYGPADGADDGGGIVYIAFVPTSERVRSISIAGGLHAEDVAAIMRSLRLVDDKRPSKAKLR